MTTPLFLLRCVQLGLSMADLELLSIGLINDMYVESRNDECNYARLATQDDLTNFDFEKYPQNNKKCGSISK